MVFPAMSTSFAYFLEPDLCQRASHGSRVHPLKRLPHPASCCSNTWSSAEGPSSSFWSLPQPSTITYSRREQDVRATTHPSLHLPTATHQEDGGSLSLGTHILTHEGHPPLHLRARRSRSSPSPSADSKAHPHAFFRVHSCALTSCRRGNRVCGRHDLGFLSLGAGRKVGFRRRKQRRSVKKQGAAALI
jgi:hypothetical protein